MSEYILKKTAEARLDKRMNGEKMVELPVSSAFEYIPVEQKKDIDGKDVLVPNPDAQVSLSRAKRDVAGLTIMKKSMEDRLAETSAKLTKAKSIVAVLEGAIKKENEDFASKVVVP